MKKYGDKLTFKYREINKMEVYKNRRRLERRIVRGGTKKIEKLQTVWKNNDEMQWEKNFKKTKRTR